MSKKRVWNKIVKTIFFVLLSFLVGILLGKIHEMLEVETMTYVEKKRVALTFDDGPNPLYTQTLLNGLRERGVKATFFLLGKEAEQYPGLVKEIHGDGHLIGIHSYEHVDFGACGSGEACEQVSKTDEILYKLTGQHPDYIRPPYGRWCDALEEQFQLIEVLWDVDPLDWNCKDAGTVERRILNKVEDGDIILMHDASATSVQAALDVIDSLTKEGYEFVTVDALIAD